jgi:hypothetical protein
MTGDYQIHLRIKHNRVEKKPSFFFDTVKRKKCVICKALNRAKKRGETIDIQTVIKYQSRFWFLLFFHTFVSVEKGWFFFDICLLNFLIFNTQ